MAILLSDLITARDTPGDITDAGTYSGDVKVTRAIFDVTVNPSDNDVIMMVDLPSNSKPNSFRLFNDDVGDGSIADFGIYAGEKFTDSDLAETLYNKNDVINVDAFDSGNTDLRWIQPTVSG